MANLLSVKYFVPRLQMKKAHFPSFAPFCGCIFSTLLSVGVRLISFVFSAFSGPPTVSSGSPLESAPLLPHHRTCRNPCSASIPQLGEEICRLGCIWLNGRVGLKYDVRSEKLTQLSRGYIEYGAVVSLYILVYFSFLFPQCP